MFKNWKTTLAGVSAIISGAVLVINGNIGEGVTAVITGIGLIFAKDGDKK